MSEQACTVAKVGRTLDTEPSYHACTGHDQQRPASTTLEALFEICFDCAGL
jgi:hypothetical protein